MTLLPPSPYPLITPTFSSHTIIPNTPEIRMKLIFNNTTYYKPGSLSMGTSTTVRNASVKSRRI